jgi:FkbM family methyltransferase
MYGVSKLASPPSSRVVKHHPVIRGFPRWEGKVPPDFIVNFLGVLTRAEYYKDYLTTSVRYPADRIVETEYPPFDEEYFEWIDLLEAVVLAKNHFTMIELGAGFGRWTVNAAVALRQLASLPHTFVAVEAEPTHFQWTIKHLADNFVDPAGVRLIQAAVTSSDGKVGFHLGDSPLGKPADWYGQHIGGPHSVDAVSLSTLLRALDTVDLIDIDVQGAELQVLEAAALDVDKSVKRIHVGTHGADIEAGLHSLFGRLGWKCLRSFSCGATVDTEYGAITFADGVQTWLNPTYSEAEKNELEILSAKLAAPRNEGDRLWRELQKLRQARYSPSTAGRLRDRIAPVGTRRRAILAYLVARF